MTDTPKRGPMTFAQYEAEALRTYTNPTIAPDSVAMLAHLTLGLVGEAGEVADIVKKHIGQGHPLDPAKVLEEMGDVLWYLTALVHHMGGTLEFVAERNTFKLRKRYPEGLTAAASMARVDVVTSPAPVPAITTPIAAQVDALIVAAARADMIAAHRRTPVQGTRAIGTMPYSPSGTIAWSEHLEIWEVYAKRWGRRQSADEIAARGGFGRHEAEELLGRPLATFEPDA